MIDWSALVHPDSNSTSAQNGRRDRIMGWTIRTLMTVPSWRLTFDLGSAGCPLGARSVERGADISRLAGGAGDEGGDDVGGVPVEGDAGAVVAHRGARVGVAGGFLDVAQRDAGVEGGGDERVAQGVGSDSLGDPGAAGDAPHDPARRRGGRVGCRRRSRKIGPSLRSPMARSTARAVRGASGMVTILPPLRMHGQGAVPALEAEAFDVGADRFRDPQPVERQQRDQGVIAGPASPAATSIAPTSLRSSPVAWDS